MCTAIPQTKDVEAVRGTHFFSETWLSLWNLLGVKKPLFTRIIYSWLCVCDDAVLVGKRKCLADSRLASIQLTF